MTWGTTAFPTTGVGHTSAAFVVTLWNTGTAPVPVASVTDSNPTAFPWLTTCQLGGTLAAGSTCKVSVTFTPSTVGDQTATLGISANQAALPVSLALTGTGATISPQVSISPAGDSAPSVYLLAVTGATPSGTLELHTIYTPAPGNPAVAFVTTTWTADTTGATTASITTDSPGAYEHWLVDLTSGLATNHVFHAVP
jgi:hypothetical protein